MLIKTLTSSRSSVTLSLSAVILLGLFCFVISTPWVCWAGGRVAGTCHASALTLPWCCFCSDRMNLSISCQSDPRSCHSGLATALLVAFNTPGPTQGVAAFMFVLIFLSPPDYILKKRQWGILHCETEVSLQTASSFEADIPIPQYPCHAGWDPHRAQ